MTNDSNDTEGSSQSASQYNLSICESHTGMQKLTRQSMDCKKHSLP